MRDYDLEDPAAYGVSSTRVDEYLQEHWRGKITRAIVMNCKGVVVDVGSGTGEYTRMPACERALGIDASKRMVAYAAKKGGDYVLGDVHSLPVRDSSVDSAICIGLAEYVDRDRLFLELARVVRPGGRVVLQCPNKYSALRAMNDMVQKTMRRPIVRADDPVRASLLRAAHRAGFEEIEWSMTDGAVWLPGALDRLCGPVVYRAVETFWRPLGRNPFSNAMLFVFRRNV